MPQPTKIPLHPSLSVPLETEPTGPKKRSIKLSRRQWKLLLIAITVGSFLLHNAIYALLKIEEPIFFSLTFLSLLGLSLLVVLEVIWSVVKFFLPRRVDK